MEREKRTILVSCLVLASCGGPRAQTGHTPPERDIAPAADPLLEQVALLDPGRAPRKPLRYSFQSGSHEPFVITIDGTRDGYTSRGYQVAELQVESLLSDGGANLELAVALNSLPSPAPIDHQGLHIDVRGLRT